MKVVLQTRITPIITVYDSQQPDTAPSDSTFSSRSLLRLLRPVVQLQDDQDRTLLKTGDFYPSLFPLIVLLAVVMVGYLIFRRS